MIQKIALMASALAVIVTACPAQAGFVSVTSNVTLLGTPPASVQPDQLTSNTQIFAFLERSNVSGGLLGGMIDSHFFHFDPTDNSSALKSVMNQTITFDGLILAVISTNEGLDNTDPTLGAPGTMYPTGNMTRRTGGIAEPDDMFSVSGNTLTITSVNSRNFGIDQLRVITQSAPPAQVVPEPASMSMLAIGLATMTAGYRLRRRSKAAAPVVA